MTMTRTNDHRHHAIAAVVVVASFELIVAIDDPETRARACTPGNKRIEGWETRLRKGLGWTSLKSTP